MNKYEIIITLFTCLMILIWTPIILYIIEKYLNK